MKKRTIQKRVIQKRAIAAILFILAALWLGGAGVRLAASRTNEKNDESMPLMTAPLKTAALTPGDWKEDTSAPIANEDTRETPGSLQIMDKEGNVAGLCPLKHTDVQADISGFIARVNVTQEFFNPNTEPVEAVYVFPLPQDAAVDDMVMTVGDRTIRADIKRREEARQIYETAKREGKVAGLLDQERPNIFTQSVANIMPGATVRITISYVDYLKYEDGSYKFVYPMVVGPRFIPGEPTGAQGTGWSPDTTQAPDASRITPPVAKPDTRAGHDISLKVNIDAGMPIRGIDSELHDVDITRQGDNLAGVELKDKNTIPNKDFVLNYQIAGDTIQDALLTHAEQDRGGFFTLIVSPPKRVKTSEIVPKEMIFVIDTSGSMEGWPVEKAKETMKYAIRKMNPNDTFNLIAFSNQVRPLFPKPQPFNEKNRDKAERYLGNMMGNGGTWMEPAMEAALTPPADPKRVRIVCFMTDGYVGNDMEIIDTVQKKLGNARLFSFGIGNSVNRFLLDEMARFGRGEVEYVLLENGGKGAAERFHERIANPVLTDIKVDWGGLSVEDVYPAPIPDLFSHKPLILTGRYSGKKTVGTITVRGKAAGKKFEKSMQVVLPAVDPAHDVLAPLWARRRIDDYMARDYLGIQNGAPAPEVREAITGLGLEYRLVTQYTSFVAVEDRIVNEGGILKTVPVPVEMPDGVSYEGVFGERDEERLGMSPGRAGGMAQMSKTKSASPAGEKFLTTELADIAIDADESSAPDTGLANIPKPDAGEKAPEKTSPSLQLAPELVGLADVVSRLGKNGNYSKDGVIVKKWIITVRVTVSAVSPENLAALKKLGFALISTAKKSNIYIGRIDVRKLDALAKLGFVQFVEAKKK